MGRESYGMQRSVLRAVAKFILAISGPRSKTITRLAAIAAIGILIVLGMIGFASYRPGDEGSTDFPTVIYRVQTLFFFNSGGEPDVPWLIDLTRLTAPFVLGFSTAVLGLTFANRWARRVLARTASDHLVLVGPWLRISHHVPEHRGATDCDIVHVVDDPVQRDACSERHLHALVGPNWIEDAHTLHARRVVISTGRDLRTVALLDELLDGTSTPTPQVEVEIDDHPTGVQLAVTLAHDCPNVDVDVVDSTVVAATTLANLIAPPVHELEPQSASRPPTYLVVATAQHHDFLLGVLIEHLELQADQSHSTVRTLCVIDPSPSAAPSIELTQSGAVRIERFTSVQAFVDAHGRGEEVRAAVLAGPDPLELSTTVELLAALPNARLWVDDAIRVPSPRVTHLTPPADARSGYWAAAASLIDEVLDDPDQPESSDGARSTEVRALVAEMAQHCEISAARLVTKATASAGDAMVVAPDRWILSALGVDHDRLEEIARDVGIDPDGEEDSDHDRIHLLGTLRARLVEYQSQAGPEEELPDEWVQVTGLVERMARLRLLPYSLAFLGIVVHEPAPAAPGNS